jgi:hypothetical protein
VTTTPDLISSLVKHATPVRRLRPPLWRALLWLAFAGLVLVLFTIGHGPRDDLAMRLGEPTFALRFAAALATGILAAVAAFMLSLPDRSRWWLLLPAPALAVWLATIGYGCFTDWVSVGPDGISFGETMRCFATLVLTGIPLSVALCVMLRYSALLEPGTVALTGALAVAAMTSATLSLLHDLDATAMILVWNLGSAALITALGTLFGRGTFAWLESKLREPQSG